VIKGGGHAMAAGVTIAGDRLPEFRAFLEAELREVVAQARRNDELRIDGALSATGATRDLITEINRAGPYGSGNPEPVFALPAHTIAHAEEFGGQHIRARLRAADGSAVSAVAFRSVGQPLGRALTENRGARVHAAGTLCLDRWQGVERVQFRICDVALAQV
jgi:single-stranded-DNA-specific exonuclease